MQNPANHSLNNTTQSSWDNALPALILTAPAITAGAFVLLLSNAPGTIARFSELGLGLLYAVWTAAVWQIHRNLSRHSNGAYPIKPLQAVIFTLLSIPSGAWLASYLVSGLSTVLNKISDLVGDVLPSSLPIVQSGIMLMDQYGALLGIAVAFGTAVSCQLRMTVALRETMAAHNQRLGRHRSMVAAGMLGVMLSAPGCLWMLGNSSIVWRMTSDPGWETRLFIASYACVFFSFGMLAWLNRKLHVAGQ
jgi:hypothetical protein